MHIDPHIVLGSAIIGLLVGKTTRLGWILCATLLVLGVAWLVLTRPWTSWGERPTEAGAETTTGD